MERITHNKTSEGSRVWFISGGSLWHFPSAHGIPVHVLKDQKEQFNLIDPLEIACNDKVSLCQWAPRGLKQDSDHTWSLKALDNFPQRQIFIPRISVKLSSWRSLAALSSCFSNADCCAGLLCAKWLSHLDRQSSTFLLGWSDNFQFGTWETPCAQFTRVRLVRSVNLFFWHKM